MQGLIHTNQAVISAMENYENDLIVEGFHRIAVWVVLQNIPSCMDGRDRNVLLPHENNKHSKWVQSSLHTFIWQYRNGKMLTF